ncbi:MAG TPA: GAF domain-containing protein, partial [Pseudomonadales bacterium]|nr:GAF domain-containing protein [Pseudomonadales bacterium]
VTEAISEQFGHYHAGIFLLDPAGDYLILRASNSQGGKKLIAQSYKIRLGETGAVEIAATSHRPQIVSENEDVIFSKQLELPETRSEIALPLIRNEVVLGVLDIHSKDANAFQSEDISVMTILAAQISSALQNTRLFEEVNKSAAETKMLLQQLGQGQWSKIASEKKLIGFRFDGSNTERLKEPVVMPKHGISNGDENAQTLAVPIKVRGQVIGTLGIRPPQGHRWAPDEIDIINAVSERMAISAENARLLQDSQDRASKEQTISAVSAKIGASFNLDSILRTAVEELGQIIPGSEVAIQLKPRNK